MAAVLCAAAPLRAPRLSLWASGAHLRQHRIVSLSSWRKTSPGAPRHNHFRACCNTERLPCTSRRLTAHPTAIRASPAATGRSRLAGPMPRATASAAAAATALHHHYFVLPPACSCSSSQISTAFAAVHAHDMPPHVAGGLGRRRQGAASGSGLSWSWNSCTVWPTPATSTVSQAVKGRH